MRLMFVFPLLFAPLLPGQNGGSVQGKVVNPNSGEPVAGAEIVLYTRQALRYETTSDAAGGFQFADVKPGDYEIRFEKEGYSFGRREPAQPYRIAAAQPAIRIRLEMSRRAALTGRVVDIEGKPMRALVKLAEGGPAVAANENGEFAIKDVEPGIYTLVAIPPAESAQNGAKQNGAKQNGAKEEVRVERIPTFYPAVSDLAGAQKIVVRGDMDIAGLEIRMQAAEVYRVRGVVLDDNGSPAPKATVSLAPLTMLPGGVTLNSQNAQGGYLTLLGPHRGAGPEQVQTKTDSNGTFEFPSVPAGDWQIAARIPAANLVDSPPVAAGAISVLVGHDDIQGLRIQKGSPFTLSPAIDWGDLPRRAGSVFLIPADGQSIAGVGSVTPNAGFRLQAVPGRYYITPSVSAGYYPDSVTLDGRDVMGQAADLFPGSSIQVSFKAARGSVQGKVDNALSTLILIPEQVTTIGFGRMAQAKPDGTFEIPGVAPGSYIIAALSGAGFQTRLDSALLAKVAAIGARVRVEQSPVAGVELGATPWLQ